MASYIADLHCHPSFKPYNNLIKNQQVDLWQPILEEPELFERIPKPLQPMIVETARSSQSNLNELFEGNVRSLFFVIHPMERGWLVRRHKSPHPIRHELLKKILKSRHIPDIAAGLSGVASAKINDMIQKVKNDDPINYYLDETFPEYEFIVQNQQIAGAQGARLKIVSNFNEYIDVVKNREKTIAGILTIEGGHALMQLPKHSLIQKEYHELAPEDQDFIRRKYMLNIDKIKGVNTSKGFDKRHTPFFISLVHMYNNFLAGHAKSYKEGTGLFPGMDDFLDQEAAMYDGISPLGFNVIERLLKRTPNERRILIDVKHMSLASRKAYYKIIEGKRQQNDPIPIIFSHGGVNGFNNGRFRGADFNADDTHGYVSHWSINLYNEDIQAIFDSDGLIGLAPHEGRMPGGEAIAMFKEIKRAINWNDHRKAQYEMFLRQEYVRLFVTNLLHIVSTINKRKAWDHICIGSDYDGIMNPFNSYPLSSNLMRLLGDIKSFLDKPSEVVAYNNDSRFAFSPSDIHDLKFNLNSRTIIKKIGFGNVDKFLEKYFTPGYLGGQGMA
ncbi:MAG: dipeptidase [Saprospiraceae bacterium]|nr:dipeptidase [Saprospiraceae bacterium]